MEVNEPHPKYWIRPSTHQTEAGLLPLDWSAAALSDLLSSKQLGGNYKNGAAETAWPLIKMGNLGRGRVDCKKVEYIHSSASPAARDRLQTGDVLFNTRNTLELVGKVAIWRDELPEAYFNSNIMRMGFDAGRVGSNAYMNYVLNTSRSISAFRSIATGTTSVAAIYGRDFQNVYLPLPSSKTEQRDIAETLTDTDALIESLEQLLTKKRQIKQGAMQELLTGERRLPNCSESWKSIPCNRLVRHHAGNSLLIKGKLPQSALANHFPAYSASGQDVWCAHYEHDGEAIVVSAVGSRCGKSFLARGKWCAIANTHVVWPDASIVDAGFLLRFLDNEDFWLKGGSGQPFVLFNKSFEQSLSLPPLTEQRRIGEVLSNMDAEITALEARLTKARALKQAMAQALLTGRIRLPVAT